MEKSIEEEIPKYLERLRNPYVWMLCFTVVVIVSVVAWKLLTADIKFDLAKFDFSDLLAILLAFFAIWMSVMFYHKNNETANLFYDNTYRFTRDMSEILGRIESGHGETLRHLEEQVQRIPIDPTQTREEIAELQAQKEAIAEEKDILATEKKELLEEFRNQAQMQEEQMQSFVSRLRRSDEAVREKEEQLQRASNELRALRNDLKRVSEFSGISKYPQASRNIEKILREIVSYLPIELLQFTSSRQVREIQKHLERMPKSAVMNLIEAGIVGPNFLPSPQGLSLIEQYLEERRGEAGK